MNAKTWLIALAALVLVAEQEQGESRRADEPAEQEVEVTVNARGRREVALPAPQRPHLPRRWSFNKRYVRALELAWTCPTSARRYLPVTPTAVT